MSGNGISPKSPSWWDMMINHVVLRYSILTYTHILPTWRYSHLAASPRFLKIVWPTVRRFFKHLDGYLANIAIFVAFYPPNSKPRFPDDQHMGRNVFDPKKPDDLGKKAEDMCVLLSVLVSPKIRIFTTDDY